MEWLQIAAIAVLTAVAAVLVKQYLPAYASFVQLGGLAIAALFTLRFLPDILGSADSLFAFAGLESGWLTVLFKTLGIALVTELAADICRDNGSNALAGVVELGGKAIILLLSLPLLRAVAEIAAGLIGG